MSNVALLAQPFTSTSATPDASIWAETASTNSLDFAQKTGWRSITCLNEKAGIKFFRCLCCELATVRSPTNSSDLVDISFRKEEPHTQYSGNTPSQWFWFLEIVTVVYQDICKGFGCNNRDTFHVEDIEVANESVAWDLIDPLPDPCTRVTVEFVGHLAHEIGVSLWDSQSFLFL